MNSLSHPPVMYISIFIYELFKRSTEECLFTANKSFFSLIGARICISSFFFCRSLGVSFRTSNFVDTSIRSCSLPFPSCCGKINSSSDDGDGGDSQSAQQIAFGEHPTEIFTWNPFPYPIRCPSRAHTHTHILKHTLYSNTSFSDAALCKTHRTAIVVGMSSRHRHATPRHSFIIIFIIYIYLYKSILS